MVAEELPIPIGYVVTQKLGFQGFAKNTRIPRANGAKTEITVARLAKAIMNIANII